MQTSTLVQASADVVRIVTLRKYDVYKRLDKQGYSETYTMWLGVVQSVDFNGEEALVSAIEVNPFSGKAEIKTYGNSSDLKIFAATPEEVQLAINDAIKLADSSVERAQRSLREELAARAHLDTVLQRVGEARVPEVTDRPAQVQVIES
jgi:hypothetical protein